MNGPQGGMIMMNQGMGGGVGGQPMGMMPPMNQGMGMGMGGQVGAPIPQNICSSSQLGTHKYLGYILFLGH